MALSLTPDDRWRSTPGPAPASDDDEEEGRVGWLAAAATDEEEEAGRFAWIPAPLAPRTEALPTWLSRLARRFLRRAAESAARRRQCFCSLPTWRDIGEI